MTDPTAVSLFALAAFPRKVPCLDNTWQNTFGLCPDRECAFYFFLKRSRAFEKTLSEDAKCVFRIRLRMWFSLMKLALRRILFQFGVKPTPPFRNLPCM